MAITATDEGTKFPPAPAGTFSARCFSMIHIGTIEETIKGKKKNLNKVRISWELPTEKKVFDEKKGEQPHVVSKDFTLSMNEKANLRKFLESWRGKGFTEQEAKAFDVTKLLGVECMLSIIHKQSKGGNTYADISAISRLPKEMKCPAQINPNFEFSLENFDQDVFDQLPDWIKQKVMSSWEYKMMKEPENNELQPGGEASNQALPNDDLPF